MESIKENWEAIVLTILVLLRGLAFSTIGQKIKVNIVWNIILKIIQSLPIIEEILKKLVEIVRIFEYKKAINIAEKYSASLFLAIENMKKMGEIAQGGKWDKLTEKLTEILKNNGISSDGVISQVISSVKPTVDAIHSFTKEKSKPTGYEIVINTRELLKSKNPEKKNIQDYILPIIVPVAKLVLGIIGIKI